MSRNRRAGGECTISLRPYQREALAAIDQGLATGVRRPLIELPTGTGKTVVFADLLRRRAGKGRGLVLVHRDELIEQAVDKLRTIAPEVTSGVVKAERDEIGAQIVVASVQTLSRALRLSKLGRDFNTVIVDEAHHAPAEGYVRILEYLRCFEGRGPLTLGLTATAERADSTPLSKVWQKIVYRRDLSSMIQSGYLCDLRGLRIQIKADLDSVQVRAGDFAINELDTVLRNANAPQHALAAYQRHAAGRKALIFTPSVATAHEMAKAFRAAGIAAETIDGGMPSNERRAILYRFRRGATRVVANCAVLTEGYDEPSVDCIINARPTRSRPLYVQMIGRGTRIHPDKPDCLIIDLVGNSTRHELVSLGGLLGLPPELLEGGKVSVREAICARGQSKAIDGRLVTTSVDLFQGRMFRWVRVDDGCFALPLPDGQIRLRASDPRWIVERLTRGGRSQEITTTLNLGYAQGAAEDYARQSRADVLSRADAPWRRDPASMAQLQVLRQWGIPSRSNLTKGEASDLITAAAARRRP
jgi:superfamily II DNA or RNA helicase